MKEKEKIIQKAQKLIKAIKEIREIDSKISERFDRLLDIEERIRRIERTRIF